MELSFASAVQRNEPWLYFAAGALLPTLAYALLLRRSNKNKTVSNHQLRAVSKESERNEGNAYDDDEGEEDESDEESEDEMNLATKGGPSSEWSYSHAPYKMVFCVNTSLKAMGKGKMAAQCCHAAVGCYKRALKQCPKALQAWEYSGCAKICVKSPDEDEMLDIAAKALSLDIPVYLVQDAGRTQIAAGSRTVLGLFAPVSVLDEVTGHLKLM
ncbi:hypothetical protein MPSEU_000611800 [Mayamaea pseudoterrestris]|nr:hypothetical protein MPSEU_000611800 [Mayamaea pseudoterrestris]